MKLVLSIACCLTFSFGSAPAATLRVPSQYPTVIAGLDAAAESDTVLVAPGTYTDAETRAVDFGNGPTDVTSLGFLKRGVKLISEGGPGVTTLDLSGEPIVGSGAVLVGSMISVNPPKVWGFRIVIPDGRVGIRLAYSVGVDVRDCDFVQDGPPSAWGISSFQWATTRVADCTFDGLSRAVNQINGRLDMDGCLISNCSTRHGAVYVDGPGYDNADMTIRNTEFVNNHADGSLPGGGAITGRTLSLSSATIEGCVFVENTTAYRGGAIAVFGDESAHVWIRRNVFIRNGVEGAGPGGAVYLRLNDHGSEIRGNTFHANTVVTSGSAIYLEGSAGFAVVNNIYTGHAGVPAFGSAVTNYLTYGCNLYWRNSGGDLGGGLPLDATDLVADPLYCDEPSDDLSISTSSPAAPAVGQSCNLIGALDPNCGPVSIEARSWARIKSLYRD